MLAGGIVAVLALSGACLLTEAREVSLPDHDIRIGNVVSADCSTASNARDAVVASIPSGRESVHLSRKALARLVHRRVPALVLAPHDDAGPVTFHAPAAHTPANVDSCFAAVIAIAAGDAINGADLASAPCEANASAPIVYDRTYGLVRAGDDIAPGAYLGRLSPVAERRPDTGDALTLVAIEGATRVERPITAAQPASRHGALFVRDADGNVFSAPLAPSDQRLRAP